MTTNKRPIAVLISDVHFKPDTVALASAAYRVALLRAEELRVPFVDCGDLLDSKAIIRAECANAVIDLFNEFPHVKKYLLVGNHTLINEKGLAHSLNFLRPYCTIVDNYVVPSDLAGFMLLPYYSSALQLKEFVQDIRGWGYDRFIMHQGVRGAYMGEYITDKSSIDASNFDGCRVISGHYHRAQDIKCGESGLWSYVGTPYTMSYAEASDGPKGYRLLKEDGSLELVPLDLRRHVIIERSSDYLAPARCRPQDLHWVKLKGTHAELKAITKKQVAEQVVGSLNFKFDKIYTDRVTQVQKNENLTHAELFDKIIDSADVVETEKPILKSLWKDILDESY